MSGEQKLRAILFYLSVVIFFLGLPFILSFALGYKFNPRTYRFVKTGLIVLKTQPQGAGVYIDKKLLHERTPLTIGELLPGKYHLKVELEKHYPWAAEVNVDAGQVTRFDKIILFPVRPNVKQLNKAKISDFWVDKDKGRVYYVERQSNSIYKSDLEGEQFQKIGRLPDVLLDVREWKISPDKEKLICFNSHQIGVIYLEYVDRLFSEDTLKSHFVILDYPERAIVNVFWHSDSYHLVVVTQDNVSVIESRAKATAVNLIALSKPDASVFYDENSDTLYFSDFQKASDGNIYDNIYRLDLTSRTYPFLDFLKTKQNEPERKNKKMP